MGDFGYAVRNREHYQIWPIARFSERFKDGAKFRPDEDIRAIIFAMGGPFPSLLKSYSFNLNSDNTEIWIKLDGLLENIQGI